MYDLARVGVKIPARSAPPEMVESVMPDKSPSPLLPPARDGSAGDRRRPAVVEVGVGSNGNGIPRLVVQGDGQFPL